LSPVVADKRRDTRVSVSQRAADTGGTGKIRPPSVACDHEFSVHYHRPGGLHRFPVARLLGLLAAGESREYIIARYPYLEPEDIDEALRYAAFLAEDETLELVR
jgi:hypothetical protein